MAKNVKTIEIKGYTFEVVRASTVSGGSKMQAYYSANYTSLDECYGRYSTYKENAFYRCLRMCRALEGRNYRITDYNGFGFTFAFELSDGAVVYITKDHDYIIY